MDRNIESEKVFEFQGKKYAIVIVNLNWVDASNYATFIGAHLATIPDEPTNVFLSFQLRQLGLGGAWIGLNDQDQEGVWIWQSGSTSPFRKWAKGEPNNSRKGKSKNSKRGDARGEDHVVMRANGEWNDYMGYAHGHAIPFIVEIP